MEKRRWFAAFSLLLALLWAGCSGDGTTLGPEGRPLEKTTPGNNGDSGGDSGAVAPRLSRLSAEIFSLRCAKPGCHVGATPTGDMSLEAGRIAGEIIGVGSVERPDLKRIDPGNPEASYLLKKLRGDGDIVGVQMPADGSAPLPREQIERIRRWIEAGAPPD